MVRLDRQFQQLLAPALRDSDPRDQLSADATPPSRWRSALGALNGKWMWAVLIPVCAIAPWLVPWPWQQGRAVATSDPSSIIVMAHSQAVTGRLPHLRELPPTDGSVRGVAATARQTYDVPVSAAAAAKVKTTINRWAGWPSRRSG
jgi:hypothetical protein